MNEPSEPESPLPLVSAPLDPDGVPPHPEQAAAEVAAFQDMPPVKGVEHVEQAVPRVRMWVMCALGFLAFAAFDIFMVAAGGQFRTFAVAGLEACPFAILAVLAYASHPKGIGGKALTLAYWIMLVAAVGIGALVLTIVGVLHPRLGGIPRTALPPPTTEQILRMLAAGFALVSAGVMGLFCFSTGIRRRAATWLDMDPQSFVHATALATAVTMTLMCTIPLLAANEPPLLWFFRPESGAKMADSANTLRSELYGLMWAVPAAFVAIGFPIKRTWREAQQRLALVWPSHRQVLVAVAIAVGLVLASFPFHFLIHVVWKALGLQMTDTKAVEALFKHAISPLGAVIVGISAGLGEELVYRGVLQPRLGIVLPALMFTALHAFQYDFDALIWVLCLGLFQGFVRKKTNTTTSALIHGTYDLLLLLVAYLFGS